MAPPSPEAQDDEGREMLFEKRTGPPLRQGIVGNLHGDQKEFGDSAFESDNEAVSLMVRIH